uniref:UBC core domain-containing protein n=1 Tax=Caenorhabditis tropicalis TaxID=1561998 RepID=A0A1I7UVA2_9PELO
MVPGPLGSTPPLPQIILLFQYAPPHTEYIVTVTIPKNYPLSAPILYCKSDPKMKFGFLEKSQWKPCIGIREVLVEACHVVTRRDLAPRLPVLPPLRFQLHTKGPKSPKKDS